MGKKSSVAPRDNLAGDHTKIPVTKRKHQKEVKWYARMQEMLRDFGYTKATSEFNLLFALLREYRKRFGITFFDLTCKGPRERGGPRALRYNVLEFSGEGCTPPVDGTESFLASMMEGTGDVLRAKDSAGAFTAEPIMRVAYDDSFPAMAKFCLDAAFETSYGETIYGNAVRVDISMDMLREVPLGLAPEDIPKYAARGDRALPPGLGAADLRPAHHAGAHRPPRPPIPSCAVPTRWSTSSSNATADPSGGADGWRKRGVRQRRAPLFYWLVGCGFCGPRAGVPWGASHTPSVWLGIGQFLPMRKVLGPQPGVCVDSPGIAGCNAHSCAVLNRLFPRK